MITIATMPAISAGFAIRLLSCHHWRGFERCTADIFVTVGRVEAASAPRYCLLRFFFTLFAIAIFSIPKTPLERERGFAEVEARSLRFAE